MTSSEENHTCSTYCKRCSGFELLQQENEKLKQDLEHLRRKVAHGCTDFGCGECDGK